MGDGNVTLTGLDTKHLIRWVIEQATAFDDGATLLDGFCRALVDAGLPLWRLSVSAPAIDPTVRGFSFNWRPGEGASLVAAPHGAESEASFKLSPVHALLLDGRTFARWRLDRLGAEDGFPLLRELQAEGGTD